MSETIELLGWFGIFYWVAVFFLTRSSVKRENTARYDRLVRISLLVTGGGIILYIIYPDYGIALVFIGVIGNIFVWRIPKTMKVNRAFFESAKKAGKVGIEIVEENPEIVDQAIRTANTYQKTRHPSENPSAPQQPVSPKPSPHSDPDSIDKPTRSRPDPGTKYPRGTFVFDSGNKDLIQKMEIRANNGVKDHPEDLETKYLLTGSNPTTPSEIVQLDSPKFYSEVTETSIRYDGAAIASHLQKLYTGKPDPKIIVAVHTHPNGSTNPSIVDQTNPLYIKRCIEQYIVDFEFFQAIHGLQHTVAPNSNELRKVRFTNGRIQWYGENRQHELAVYDGWYDRCKVIVE